MSKTNLVNAVAFIMSANLDAVQAKALKVSGDVILNGIFDKATKGMDDKTKGLIDNPVSRIGFVNGAVGLAHSHRVPELGMVATALFASAYGELMDAAAGQMSNLAGVFKGSCLNLQLPTSVESEALAMVSGVKAGNDLETVFNEAKGGQHIIDLPLESEVKPEPKDKAAEKPAAKAEPKPAPKAEKGNEYRPTKESELKPKPKNMVECPRCGKDRKKDKMKLFAGTEMGVGDEWKGILICAECKHGFTTESDKLKKSKAEEYAAIQAEAKRKEAEAKAAERVTELTKEIAELVGSKEFKDAKHKLDVVEATGITEAVAAVIQANADTLGKYESLNKELEKLALTAKKGEDSEEGKKSAIAAIVAQAS